MNLSLGEYEALVAKALKGVGYPWGLASDGAWAARQLARFDPGSPAAVVELCSLADGHPLGMPELDWSTPAKQLCPICVGTTVLDTGSMPSEPLASVALPQLMAPFLAELGEWYDIVSPTGRITVRGPQIVRSGEWSTVASTITIESRSRVDGGQVSTDVEQPRSRAEVSNTEFATLNRFAHRTYAPATEESRRSGAGES